MDKDMKLNSPRTLEVCRINGVLPEELYYIEYKDYLSAHPEISNLPEDIKQYRFNLLEKLRQKTIKMIKVKRRELIEQQENHNDTEVYEKKEKLTQYNNTPEHEYQTGNITFSEKMNSMIKKERANIKKIKQKQKQNIEFMIEQQMKAELINYRNIEKDKKVKENKEKKKKEIHEKSVRNQRIQEEMKQKRLTNVEEMMKKRRDKISTKHDKIEKKINYMKEEKEKRREDLIQKRTQELIKISNHRSQLDIFRQEQEKKLIELKLTNDEKEKKVLERVKNMQQKRKELNNKRRDKSAELLLKNHEKKEEQLNQLIDKINKKHEDNKRKLQEYYKDLEIKAQKLKEDNIKKRNTQESLLKSMEQIRQKKIDDYLNDNVKKEQNVIIRKMINKQKVINQKIHEDEFLEMVQGHKHELDLEHQQKKIDLQNRMDEMDQRITNYKKQEEHKSLKKLQESFAKQVEKDFVNKRIQRMKEYKFELKEKEIEDKEKRFEFMKSEKQKYQNERKKLNIELQNEKHALINKFNNLVKGKSKIDSEIVKKLYPEDEALYKKIKNMQNIYSLASIDEEEEEAKEKERKKVRSRSKSASRKKNEEEIYKKVEEFRRRLRESISKDIETERINEAKRIRDYEEATTVDDKKKIELRNKGERKEFDKKITELNENIERYVEDYRTKLMKEVGYC